MMKLKRRHKNNLYTMSLVFGIFILVNGMNIALPTVERIAVKNSEKSSTSDIGGLYYLRDDDPLNWVDVGSLLMDLPVENESTLCGMFINFHFAQPGDYIGYNTISNIYYRFWQKGYIHGIEYEIGYSTSSDHTAGFNESIWVDTNDYICEVNNYRLVQVIQSTNPEIAVFEDDEIYNFTIKFFGPNPNILCNPNQYSFVILNLEDNLTLQKLDRDNDLLNDYDELFVFYTNPFDSDTDNDGYSDYSEVNLETDPNDFNDNMGPNNNPNMPIIKGPLNGKVGKDYEYKFSSTDPDDDDIYYYILWGDGHVEIWDGPYASGEDAIISHTYARQGTFIIEAKAKDIYGMESDWGYLEVAMPISQQVSQSISQRFSYRLFYSILGRLLNLI